MIFVFFDSLGPLRNMRRKILPVFRFARKLMQKKRRRDPYVPKNHFSAPSKLTPVLCSCGSYIGYTQVSLGLLSVAGTCTRVHMTLYTGYRVRTVTLQFKNIQHSTCIRVAHRGTRTYYRYCVQLSAKIGNTSGSDRDGMVRSSR